MAGDFLNAADATQIARATIALKLRTKSFPEGWWANVLLGTSLTLERADAERLCAAYETFSGCTLVHEDNSFRWREPEPPSSSTCDEIAALRRELEQLKLKQGTLSEESIAASISTDPLNSFLLLKGPAWIKDICEILSTHKSSMSPDYDATLLAIWRLLSPPISAT
jgi:hypothetical protein